MSSMTYRFCPRCGVPFDWKDHRPTFGPLKGSGIFRDMTCPTCEEVMLIHWSHCKETEKFFSPTVEPQPKTLAEEIEQVNRLFGPKCRTCGADLPDGGVTGYCKDCKPGYQPTADCIAEMVEAIEAIDEVATTVLKRHGYQEIPLHVPCPCCGQHGFGCFCQDKPATVTPDRLAKLREKYGGNPAIPMVEATGGIYPEIGYTYTTVDVINELLGMLEAKESVSNGYLDIPEIRRQWNKWTRDGEPVKTINKLCDEIERLKRE